MEKHHFFLIPGFFGFAELGGITYFHHVREFLEERCRERGIEASICYVETLPTASIRARTEQLMRHMEREAGGDEDPIHLIGHSTGGLDARLFVTPDVALPRSGDAEAFASRVRSVVTVATPHHGTPSAAFFATLFGEKLLYAWSLGTVYVLKYGRLPLKLAFKLAGMLTRVDNVMGFETNAVDQFYAQLFADFGVERQAAIKNFLDHIVKDRSAVGQLTPGAMDLFNASVGSREEVKYGCVTTRGARPGLDTFLSAGIDPYQHASSLIYQAVYRITSRSKGEFPSLGEEQKKRLLEAYEVEVTRGDSDGIVPTLSQVHGEVIHAATADHLDVCGHFHDPQHDPPHIDWLVTGSGFRRPHFEALWGDVVDFLPLPPE